MAPDHLLGAVLAGVAAAATGVHGELPMRLGAASAAGPLPDPTLDRGRRPRPHPDGRLLAWRLLLGYGGDLREVRGSKASKPVLRGRLSGHSPLPPKWRPRHHRAMPRASESTYDSAQVSYGELAEACFFAAGPRPPPS